MHGGINETLMVQQKSQAKCVSHVVFILKHCCAGNALLILSSSLNYVSVRLFECTGGCLEAGCSSRLPLGNKIGSRANRGIFNFVFYILLGVTVESGTNHALYRLGFSELSAHLSVDAGSPARHLPPEGRTGASKWKDLNCDQLHCREFLTMITNRLIFEELVLHVWRVMF